MQTIEDRLEQEVEELRKIRDELMNEKHELRARLIQAGTLINTPASDEQEDVRVFGRAEWVYCRQHMKAHQTGWCSVSPRDKVGLGVKTVEEAYQKCRDWGLELYSDKYPNS